MSSILQNKKLVFIVFTFGTLLALVLPDLLQHGMFMDGTQYACVSKNLADGKSSFWLPFLNSAWDKHHVNYFLEHPPLVYYLQSRFFILCNDSFLSERFYCFFTLLICAYLIYKIWQLIFEDDSTLKNYWWLPVFIWIIIPSVSWSFKNNMHENTLSVFVLAASFFALKSIHASKGIIYVVASGICIFLATLSKGLPGFFPLVIFVLHYLVFKKLPLKKTIMYSFLLIAVPDLIYGIIYYSNSNARFSLDFYINYRLLDRINNSPEVSNRFTILFWLFMDLLVPVVLAIIIGIGFKQPFFEELKDNNNKKRILFFILLGLSGIIPLTLTHVQRAVYFVPAMPFIAFGVAIFLVKGLRKSVENIAAQKWKWFALFVTVSFVAVIGVSIYFFDKTGRDAEEQNMAKEIAEKTGKDKIIGTSFAIYSKWSLQFYLLRNYNITLDAAEAKTYQYKLFENGKDTAKTSGFTRLGKVAGGFEVYKKLN